VLAPVLWNEFAQRLVDGVTGGKDRRNPYNEGREGRNVDGVGVGGDVAARWWTSYGLRQAHQQQRNPCGVLCEADRTGFYAKSIPRSLNRTTEQNR
jgi:hypothetical protein